MAYLRRVEQHFGARDGARREELVVGELRQLRRAEHHLVAHQQRRRDFGVAVVAGVHVEHELPERALHARKPALEHDEARARQFRRGLEIHLAERFAQLEMLLGRERVVALRRRNGGARHCRSRRRRPAPRRAADSGFPPAPCRVPRPPPSPRASSAGMSSFSFATSAISFCARSSSLLFLAAPISREAALRRASAASDFWIAARRRSSIPIEPLRLARRARAASSARVEGVGVVANPFDVVHGRLGGRACKARHSRQPGSVIAATDDLIRSRDMDASSRATPAPDDGVSARQSLRRIGLGLRLRRAAACAFRSTIRTE